MAKRTPEDISVNLNLKEDRFKKSAEKFNWALRELQQRFTNEEKEVLMFHIILSLQNYFDFEILMNEIIDKKNRDTIISEMQKENYIKQIPGKKKGGKRAKKASK